MTTPEDDSGRYDARAEPYACDVELEDQIVQGTRLLREDDHPLWIRLRECLTERGVDVGSALLAISFPDDSALEFGIIVTGDDEVYEYEFDWLHKPIEEGVLRAWRRPPSGPWGYEGPWHEEVDAALALRQHSL